MGAFTVKFGMESNYSDPEYKYIVIKVIGETGVVSDSLKGSDEDQTYIRNIMNPAISNALSVLSGEKISYRDLASHKERFSSAVTEALNARSITVTSFKLIDIAPNDSSRKIIEQMDKMNAISRMTPEELARLQQEKLQEAQRVWDALSPEEKARVEAENKRRLEEDAERMKQTVEAAQKIVAASAGEAAVRSIPKFCPNCGTPTGGCGKFCSNCGTKLE